MDNYVLMPSRKAVHYSRSNRSVLEIEKWAYQYTAQGTSVEGLVDTVKGP